MEKYKSWVRGFSIVALLGAALGVASCATNGTLKTGEEIEIGRTTFSEDMTSEYKVFPDYRISPGDVLDVLYQVKSWEEQPEFKIAVDHVVSVRFIHYPELNETQRVRPDGNVSLAYLGSVRVIGKTVEELTASLKEQYAEHLKDPELYIVLEEFRGAIKELKADLKTAPRGLSRLVTVRPDGYATFAMLGDIYVAGHTVPVIAEVLGERYQAILPGLSADLFLEKHSGSLIYVFGEVNAPGSYQILRPTSIFEAVAMAGSVQSSARVDSAIIFRQKKDKLLATRINLKSLMMPRKLKERQVETIADVSETEEAFSVLKGEGRVERSEYQLADNGMFYLYPDDIVYIPRRRLNSAAEIMREVGDIFLFRGWGLSFDDTFDVIKE